MENKTDYILHFAEIWRRFERDNRDIMAFRTALDYNLKDSEKVRSKVLESVNLPADSEINDIYLIGFYYVTAIQKRFIETLINAGFNIHIWNDHDSDNGFFTRIWEETYDFYSSKRANMNDDIIQKNIIEEIINGKRSKKFIKVIKDYSEFDFIKTIEEAEAEGARIYSPDDKNANSVLEKLMPEKLKKRHLLSYPVGQYIYFLHLMWDSEINQLNYKFDYVFRCFSSGWLITDNDLNGINYTYELKILEPYLKGLVSATDWINKIKTLRKTRTELRINDYNDRLKNKLDNCYNLIGAMHSIDDNKYNDILSLFIKLSEDAEILFKKESLEIIDVYKHFQDINNIISTKIGKENVIDSEIEVAKELIKKLSLNTSRGMKCTLSGVRDAIIMMLGGGLSDEDEEEQNNFISGFTKIDAAVFSDKPLYIVLADEFSLPAVPDEFPWPLNENIVRGIYDFVGSKRGKYMETTISMMKNKPLASRYLLFKILNEFSEKKIVFEWISNKNDREIDVSPYIRAINPDIYDRKHKVNLDSIRDEVSNQKDTDPVDILQDVMIAIRKESKSSDSTVVQDAFMVCRYRGIYSYLLSDVPEYISEFQQKFLYPKLIDYTIRDSSVNDTIKLEILSNAFPFFRDIDIAQSEEYVSNNDKLYNLKQRCHFPSYELIKALRDNNYKKIEEIKCKFCPHSSECLDRNVDNN